MKMMKLCLFILMFATLTLPAHSAVDTLLRQRARELADSGMYDASFKIYKGIQSDADSAFYESYDSRIESLYNTYQIDSQKLTNRRTLNRMLVSCTILIAFLSLLFLALHRLLMYKTKQLRLSQEELQKAKEMAETSVQEKSAVISNMSHEIRTPLNSLVGFSNLLAEGDLDEETLNHCNDIIKVNSELLLKLINDVIDVSCLDMDHLNINLKSCDAVSICENIIDTFRKFPNTDADIIFNCKFDSLRIDTDPTRLQQVLFNLMSNAVKFCKAGSITLALEKATKNKVCFSVTDTGCGIAQDKINIVFNRFERVEEITSGTGIGLSLSKLIVQRLGGKIYVDPNYTDGARFVFTHPIKQEIAG